MIRLKTRAFWFGTLVVLLGVIAGGGCSFGRAWRKAAAVPTTVSDLEGRWQGSWHSDSNGHHGKLRCVITKTSTESPDTYQARFHAKYLKVLSFGYTVQLKAERTNNGFQFRGEADLGRLAGGVYRYEGHAEGTNFFSTYTSKYDHGTFQMARP